MYNNSLNQLSRHFSDYNLNEIILPMVEEYKRIRSKTVSLASVDRDLATLKRLFSFMEEQGHIEKNPIRKVKLFRPCNERERMLTETEIKRLLDACSIPYLRLAVLIALNTGLRKATIMGLRWDNVDLNRKVIRVRTKGDKMVNIPLTALYSPLVKWKRDNPGSPFLFRSARGKGSMNRDSIKRSFATACETAKLSDFRFHDLRHTFASVFIMRTGDLRTCQELLGHSTATMTRRYSHLLDSHIRQAVKRFGGIGISRQVGVRQGDQVRGRAGG
jgi:integrase